MANKRNVLGRGLSALIPEDIDKEDEQRIHEIDTSLIRPNPNQPRKVFEKDKLEELTESIKQHGVIQPIIVRKDGDFYTIIAGERRWRACNSANIKKIPSIVRDIENKNASEIALIENIQREDLNPIDEATAYEYIMERYGITQEEVSTIVGKSRVYVTNIMRLLNLDEYVREKIKSNEITEGHGRAMLGISPVQQIVLADKIVSEQLSVRDVENLVRKNKKIKKPLIPVQKDKFVAHVEELMTEKFSSRVTIKRIKNKGKIEIEYINNDDLNRILDILNIKE